MDHGYHPSADGKPTLKPGRFVSPKVLGSGTVMLVRWHPTQGGRAPAGADPMPKAMAGWLENALHLF